MDISILLQDIVACEGWIAGSYVRDVLVRQDPNYVIRDLDVLIPFELHKKLVTTLMKKYNLDQEVLDYNPDEHIIHTELDSGTVIIDIFSSEEYEYLSPPDFDVNTLCWTGEKFTIWYPVRDNEEELYKYPLDVDSIKQRALANEAIAMMGEWSDFDKEYMIQRFYKLANKGWSILNYEEASEFLVK